jgi:deoxyribodipyrimidine photo-lyase
MSERIAINVVWLKRDLRLEDNEAITNALKANRKTLLLYVFEPLLLNDEHYSERHFNFIKESLRDLNSRLAAYNTKILSVTNDLVTVFNQIQDFYKVQTVFFSC